MIIFDWKGIALLKTARKSITILIACAIMLTCISACTIKEIPVITAEPESPVTETPQPSASFEEIVSEFPWTPLPEDYENATEQAINLVLQDMWAIDFLINLSIDGEYIFEDIPGDLWYTPVTVPEYTSFTNLLSRLDGVYTTNDSYSNFFRYPVFGDPQIDDFEGEVYVYPHYYSNFETKIDADTVKVTELTEDRAVFSFDIYGHEYFSDGSMAMSLTADGWRLDGSFFFYCLNRFDLLDIESSTPWELNPILDTDQNIGSAKRLTGDCMFYNIFVDDKESSWDSDSVADLYTMQDNALRYLEFQAAQFGHELNCFATGADEALYVYIDDIIPTDGSNSYELDLYFMSTQYGSVNGLLKSLSEDNTDHDNYGLIFNVNKQGRSYAVPCNTVFDDHELYDAERAVIFYSTDIDYEYYLTGGTIAHEVLHLFGAIDLYYPNDGEDIRKQIIMQYFPFELMHYVPYYADDSTISVFTAFRVGWRNTLPDQLMMFQAKG